MTTNVAIQADQQPMSTATASNHYERGVVTDTVTITISRKAAEKVADWPDDERYPFSAELGKAARAALEGER